MTDAPRWSAEDCANVLRYPTVVDDKYSRGVVGVRTGSQLYPGAAVLGVEAAWRTGVGMVRYIGPPAATSLVLQRRPETVTAAGRVQAWVIGSGTDAAARTLAETTALAALLQGDVPVVADAGALLLAAGGQAPRILTPHANEFARLREGVGLTASARVQASVPVGEIIELARVTGAVVLLKGATTRIVTPQGWVAVVESPTSWLATAGTGDVLAAIIGAVVAGVAASAPAGLTPEQLAAAAATAAWLHSHAARAASEARGGGPIVALDIAAELPAVVADALAHGVAE